MCCATKSKYFPAKTKEYPLSHIPQFSKDPVCFEKIFEG